MQKIYTNPTMDDVKADLSKILGRELTGEFIKGEEWEYWENETLIARFTISAYGADVLVSYTFLNRKAPS